MAAGWNALKDLRTGGSGAKVGQQDTKTVSGVQFAEVDGKRSSQAAGKSIFSEAVDAVDPSLASEIRGTSDWRKRYLAPVRSVLEVGTRSPSDAVRIASDGLSSVRRNLVFVKGAEDIALDDALGGQEHSFHTETVKGEADRPEGLEVPLRGQVLSQDSLKRQLANWVEAGVMEPSAAAAVESLIDDPSLLNLADLDVVLLGAGSQMGPLEMLCRWGAHVIAVDLPRPHIWEQIIGAARRGSGRLTFPAAAGSGPLEQRAGADLLEQAPEVTAWLSGLDAPFTIGNYVYADGSNFVRLSGAVDAMINRLLESGAASSLSYLATPTDVFAVPEEAVEGARAASRARNGAMPAALRAASGKRLYVENYGSTVKDTDGRTWGISDCLVPVQGPNYALAKSMQRWRAVAAREAGHSVSANVAPATRTASVTKNRILAAAYNGAHRFGIDIFEPETSRALMAALLVHDLRNSSSSSSGGHPYEMFASGAVHGGLWRSAYEPRSVLPIAVLGGLAKRR